MSFLVRISLLVTICLATAANYSFSQDIGLAKWQARYDLSYLERYLLLPYQLFSSEDRTPIIQSVFDSLIQEINHYPGVIPQRDFFNMVATVIAETQERHCKVFFPGSSFIPIKFLDDTQRFFPFKIDFIDGHAVVRCNLSEEKNIKKGDIILSINNIPVDHIAESLMKYIPSDGDIMQSKWLDLSDDFHEYYYYHIAHEDSFSINILRENDQFTQTFQIKALPEKVMLDYQKSRYPDTDKVTDLNQLFDLTFLSQPKCALLTIKTFYRKRFSRFGGNYSLLLQHAFEQIDKSNVNKLIIDVRDNRGGNLSSMFELLAHLIEEKYEGAISISESADGIPDAYSFPAVKKPHFDGDLYVLTNGGTFSAGAEFASLARHYGCALIVGTETSSRYEGFMAGFFKKLVLPHSRLKVSIPQKAFDIQLPEPEHKDRGLMPDIWVSPTLCDYLMDKDIQLDYLIDFVKEDQSKYVISEQTSTTSATKVW